MSRLNTELALTFNPNKPCGGGEEERSEWCGRVIVECTELWMLMLSNRLTTDNKRLLKQILQVSMPNCTLGKARHSFKNIIKKKKPNAIIKHATHITLEGRVQRMVGW